MSDLQTISITVGILTACITVIIGVISFLRTNRRAEEQRQLTLETQQQALETRQAQLFTQIHAWWRTRDAVKAYGNFRYKYTADKLENDLSFEEWVGKYGAEANPEANPEAYADSMSIWAFFEGIGVLVKKSLIDVELVEDLFSQRIIWIWENFFLDWIDDARMITDDPTQYDSFEYLYNVMRQRVQQKAVST